VRIDSYSIVLTQQNKVGFAERDGAKYIAGLCMLKGIAQGLSGNHFHLILNHSVKPVRLALNNETKISRELTI
jgi:hypothetical protein